MRRIVRAFSCGEFGDGSTNALLDALRAEFVAEAVGPDKWAAFGWAKGYADYCWRAFTSDRADVSRLLDFDAAEVAPFAPGWVDAARAHEIALFGYCVLRGWTGGRFPMGRRAFASLLRVTPSAVRAFAGKATRRGFMKIDAPGICREYRLAYYRLTGEGVVLARGAVNGCAGLAKLVDYAETLAGE